MDAHRIGRPAEPCRTRHAFFVSSALIGGRRRRSLTIEQTGEKKAEGCTRRVKRSGLRWRTRRGSSRLAAARKRSVTMREEWSGMRQLCTCYMSLYHAIQLLAFFLCLVRLNQLIAVGHR